LVENFWTSYNFEGTVAPLPPATGVSYLVEATENWTL